MIDSLINIIIPCFNSIHELKQTLDSIARQTKIRGTRIIVLDKGSTDGTHQYAHQASIEYKRVLNINVVEAKENNFPLTKEELKNYLIWISPGTTLDSSDSIMNIVNNIDHIIDFCIYKRKKINPFSYVIDRVNLKRGHLQIECLICKKEDVSFIEYFKENNRMSFKLLKDPNISKIRILRENILSQKKTTIN